MSLNKIKTNIIVENNLGVTMANIEKRKNGIYRITISRKDPITGDHVRHRKNVEAKNKTEAEKEAIKFEADIERNMILTTSRSYKFAELAQKWLDEYARENLAPKTVSSYIRELNSKAIPYIGHFRVDKITPIEAMRYTNQLKKHKIVNSDEVISKRTQSYVWKIVHKIFNDAVKWQMIPYNPFDRIEGIKVKKKDKKVSPHYSVDQLTSLFEEIERLDEYQSKWKIGIYLIGFTGIRSGEALALEWTDIHFGEVNNDFKDAYLDINKSRQYVAGVGVVEKEPKNESSVRYVSIGKILAQKLYDYKLMMDQWKREFGTNWLGSKKVICNIDGGEVHPGSLTKWFTKFVRKTELEYMTIHGLRHTHTTLLIYANNNKKAIRDRLGWSSDQMINEYSHRLEAQDKEVSDTFDQLFKKGGNEDGSN